MCTRADACSFLHNENKRGKVMRPSSLALKSQTHSDGKILREGKVLSGRSPSGKRSRRPCKDYISGECTNHVTFGVLPNVNIQNTSGCKFVEKCVFRDKELTVSQTKNRKRMVVKALLPCGRIPSISVAYSRM